MDLAVPEIEQEATAAEPWGEPLRRQARAHYWRGWSLTQISEEMGIAIGTVSAWKRRHKWDLSSQGHCS